MNRIIDPIMRRMIGEIRDIFARTDIDTQAEFLNEFRAELSKLSPQSAMPVDVVRWIPVEDVEANDYNPNSVAPNEMRLLHTSISHDGYTQPVVAIYDAERRKYVIVDGFHRFSTCKLHDDIRAMTNGRVPVVVIDKSINDRMASTVRHNRARGKHSVDGMADMVFAMLDQGWTDADICNEVGLEPEELTRLKHVTGFSKLFENAEYRRAWTTGRQAKFKREFEQTGKVSVDGKETEVEDPVDSDAA